MHQGRSGVSGNALIGHNSSLLPEGLVRVLCCKLNTLQPKRGLIRRTAAVTTLPFCVLQTMG